MRVNSREESSHTPLIFNQNFFQKKSTVMLEKKKEKEIKEEEKRILLLIMYNYNYIDFFHRFRLLIYSSDIG